MNDAAISPPVGSAVFWREWWRGFRAFLPLWLGVIPFGLALAVLATEAGVDVIDMSLMTLIVYAGSGQLAIVRLMNDGAGAVAIVLTVVLLNLRHVLYGISLNGYFPATTRPARPFLAYLLTDEAYGLAVHAYRSGFGSVAYYLGAGSSLWVSYLLSTVGGVVIGQRLPDPSRYGMEMIFPLSFLALLLPLLRARTEILVAIGAGLTALAVSLVADGGTSVLTATIVGSAAGAWLTRERAA